MTRRPPRRATLLPFLAVAVVLHLIGLGTAPVWSPWLGWRHPLGGAPAEGPLQGALRVVRLDDGPDPEDDAAEAPDDEDAPEPEPPEPPKPPVPDGQIVDVAPPEREQRPEDAEYLAEHDADVLEETRSQRFKVNPDVIAHTYSDESRVQLQGDPVPDLGATEPATGAMVGNDRFDLDRHGTVAALPGHWQATNRLGYDAPVPSSVLRSVLQGAPQNDLLDEKRGDATQLDTHEFLYAAYLNRIRRLVNFYWNQNVDNLPSSVRLVKPEYTTTVLAVLEGDGSLASIRVADHGESGSRELDDAVLRAFRVAAPFENPPEGMIEDDGYVRLPEMGFTVTLGHAEMQFQGIDPRAGVQFPGILKAPR